MKKLALFVALVAAMVPAVLSNSAFADSPGQLAGGDLYQVRNVTKNTGYANNVAATCNETVKFSFKLSNTEYGMLYGVKVSANLSNGYASASATNSNEETVDANDTVHLTLTNGTLEYITGSSKLYTVDGSLIKTLPDGIVTGGVTTGNLAGSTREFVQFEAKVNCPEQPKEIQVCKIDTKKIVTINENDYDASVYTKDLSKCETLPELPHTGNSGLLGGVVLSVITAGIAYALQRRNSLG